MAAAKLYLAARSPDRQISNHSMSWAIAILFKSTAVWRGHSILIGSLKLPEKSSIDKATVLCPAQ